MHPGQYRPAPDFRRTIDRLMSWRAPVDPREIRKAYDRLAADEDYAIMLQGPERLAKKIGFLAEMVEELKAQRVVDAGCGSGRELGYLALAFPDVSFIGWDVSPKLVELGRERLRHHRIENVALHVGEHTEFTCDRIGGAANLVYTKGSLGAGDSSPVPGYALESRTSLIEFANRDPGLRRQQDLLAGLAGLVASGGRFVNICSSDFAQLQIVVEQARLLGLIHDGRVGTFAGAPPSIYTELEVFIKK